MISGYKIIINDQLTHTVEDWSDVRSPSRARRRRKRGFPQRIRFRQVPDQKIVRMGDMLVMHSVIYEELMRRAGGYVAMIREPLTGTTWPIMGVACTLKSAH